MKSLLKTGIVAAVLAVGMTGCEMNMHTRREPVHYGPAPVVYVQEEPGFWVHQGRVYERDRPGNFYIFEGGRRGPPIRDSHLTVNIQREGRHYGDFREADRNRHDNRRPNQREPNSRRR